MSELLLSKMITDECMFFPMENVIQNYAWGSYTSLSKLFGISNQAGEPQAEIWMGAHPNGCSTIIQDGKKTKLSAFIDQNRDLLLSEKVAHQFGELPYLFKVLAAEKALSIQVHPCKYQAEQGFALEEQQGIHFSADNRNYKDANHKPELVYALTNYQAMNGFRSIKEIITYFSELDISELTDLLSELVANQTNYGLANFFSGLLSLQGKQRKIALAKLLSKARQLVDPIFELILELAEQYPDDVGLFAPLMLNVITLKPGDAMYLDAQTPHAYLKGTGLEIMASSDNVLRAGLTAKHIDVEELISCTLFEEKPSNTLLLKPIEQSDVLTYPIPIDDFKFAIIQCSSELKIDVESAEILFVINQKMVLTHECGQSCVIKKGQSVFIPAYAKHYTISCQGPVARAYS